MHEATQLLTVAGVLLLGFMSPGPNFAVVTATAMRASRRAGVLAALGLAAASGTWAVLAVAGLGLLLAQVPPIHTAVRLAGAAYLIWLGARMLIEARRPLPAATDTAITGAAAFRKAYLVSMTNPKALAFYGSILSVTVPAHAPAWFLTAVVAIAAIVSAAWYGGLALLFSQGPVQRLFAKTGIDITMGAILIGLGGKLLAGR